ncbi:hypothetical protein [Fontimonas thermophila]|uniref:hypothetical protein n=1 Tax=Fontimonas thermophila TaxID=1076937 RepID=UPI000B86A7EE|nr:hypothetical protein [Fontimonas thermophila]
MLAIPVVQVFLKARIGKIVNGPDEATRSKQPTYVWSEARNARGAIKTARIRTENVYSLTVTAALTVIQHLMHHKPAGDAYTPARLCGADLVTRLPGCGPMQVS